MKANNLISNLSVQSRLSAEDGLNFCELSYQLMQGYDFFHLNKNFGVNVQVKIFLSQLIHATRLEVVINGVI